MSIGIQSLAGIYFEDFQFPFLISGNPDPVNDVGKAVTLDATAANTVKLAGAGDKIVGRLETVEARTAEGITVATVAVKFSDKLPIANGQTPAVGNIVVGGGSGTVQVGGTGSDPFVPSAFDPTQPYVVEVPGDGTVVVLKI